MPYEELPEPLRQLGDSNLDFGLWDHGKAYSKFRQHEGEWTRNIKIVFSLERENCDVKAKVDLYKQMLRHAWLVDKKYIKDQNDFIEELKADLKEGNKHLLRRTGNTISPEDDFYIQVADENEIRKKVETLVEVWKLTREERGVEQASEVVQEEEDADLN